MDPLSDVLSLLRPRSQSYAGLDAAGHWSFDFPPHEGIKFTAVMRGTCWGITEDLEQPIRFDEGDCFLLNSRRRFVLSSDPSLPVESGAPILAAVDRDGVAIHNGGGEVFLIGGRFTFSGNHAAILFDALPPLINIPRSSNQAEILRWSLDQWAAELRHPQPGGALMSTHLAHLMLVQVLRLFLMTSSELPKGWFLADAAGSGSPADRQRARGLDRLLAGLRVRKLFQHGLQAHHGLLADAVSTPARADGLACPVAGRGRPGRCCRAGWLWPSRR